MSELLAKRQRSHGAWRDTARNTAALKGVLDAALQQRAARGKPPVPAEQHEALHMILGKIARIVAGDPHHEDHWLDIAGYADLARTAPPPREGA